MITNSEGVRIMIKRTLTKPMRLTLDEPRLNKRNTIEEYCEQLLDVTEY